ncbi:glycosyl transferase group 1 [Orrella marina]|uniref:Glycosyl transferase group 1 n=2 Tax=Orrella marina TaxID=2163011 RepID=A0A2R4XFJ8_9BURK|nr:glycosyl transferase group 1 [Orrella marina]
MDPWVHYWRFGKTEGRLPQGNRVLVWDEHLWAGAHAVMVPRLQSLLSGSEAEGVTPQEKLAARWALARWFAWECDWNAVLDMLLPGIAHFDESLAGAGPWLLCIEALCRQSRVCVAQDPENVAHAPSMSAAMSQMLFSDVLNELKRRYPDHADTALAMVNAQPWIDQDSPQARLGLLNEIWLSRGLSAVGLKDPYSLVVDGPEASEMSSHPPSDLRFHIDNLVGVLASTVPFEGRDSRKDLVSTIAGVERGALDRPLVSVIIPLYNAARTIETAVRSLFEQTWRPLEIIVVDDGSKDEGPACVQDMMSRCPSGVSLRLVQLPENVGAYAARNAGMTRAKGVFLTTHDSDDWSHPDKISRQVGSLEQNPNAKASMSWWVRATDDLLFHRWRLNHYGWTYPNLSSLMIRSEVLDVIGFWDEVRVNGDSEYWERLRAVWGDDAVVFTDPQTPLSIGRADEGSLSQHRETHLVSEFNGVRKDYMQSARRWHARFRKPQTPTSSETPTVGRSELYLASSQSVRAFPAPVAICKKKLPVQHSDPLDEIQYSGLFDAGWYLETCMDLQSQRIDPIEHYWRNGVDQGRDPGPCFSTSGYLAKYPAVLQSGLHPLIDYLREGRAAARDPCPVLEGRVHHKPGRQTVLLVGHIAGPRLYGAERSLLDVARAVRQLGYNLVVCLPGAVNVAYCDALRAESVALKIMPYGWWQTGKMSCAITVEQFRVLFKEFNVDLVHVNTLVLDEPLIAARQAGVPCLIHVRELPDHDKDLCWTLNATPQQLLHRVQSLADQVVANSLSVARWISSHASEVSDARQSRSSDNCEVVVVPNTIAMNNLLELPLLAPPWPDSARADDPANQITARDQGGASSGSSSRPFAVGMISSNLPKKGLNDLVDVARHLEQLLPKARVLVAGPRTPELQDVLVRQASGEVPSNLVYAGYVESPEQVLLEMDVLVNLSHFQESFGRTVLEAMAAGRPVVAYEWGAIPELIVDGETGYLVPFKDTQAVAEKLVSLAQSDRIRVAFGQAARKRAIEGYHPDVLAQRLKNVYESMLDRV